MTLTLTILAILILVAAALYAAAVYVLARAVVYPRRAKPTAIVAVPSATEVVVSANQLTRFRGTLGLLYDKETKLAVLAPGEVDGSDDTVRRTVLSASEIPAGTDGRACGNVFEVDAVASEPPTEVQIGSEGGGQPAWLYAGTGAASSTWAIHVHGMLAGRDSALRSAHSVAASGYTSLVVSYRGDGDQPGEKRMPSMLGQTEWEDLDAAIGFALNSGATRIVVVGWSLGATIALEQQRRGAHRDAVDALVLVSPVLNWRQTIHFGMSQQRVPRWLASSAIGALASATYARLLSLPHPLELPQGLPGITLPTLILHSAGDRTTPYSASEQIAATSSLVTLDTFPDSPHAMEWNVDPGRFQRSINSFISAHQQQNATRSPA